MILAPTTTGNREPVIPLRWSLRYGAACLECYLSLGLEPLGSSAWLNQCNRSTRPNGQREETALKQFSERLLQPIRVAKEAVTNKPLMRPILAGATVIPVGGFFFELAIHHRQPHGLAIAIVLFVLSYIVVWTWLQGWLKKVMLTAIALMYTLSLSLVDFSKPANANQGEKEETVQQVIEKSFREHRDYLDIRLGSFGDMLQELRKSTNEVAAQVQPHQKSLETYRIAGSVGRTVGAEETGGREDRMCGVRLTQPHKNM